MAAFIRDYKCTHVWEACSAALWWHRLNIIKSPEEEGRYALKRCLNCMAIQWIKEEEV